MPWEHLKLTVFVLVWMFLLSFLAFFLVFRFPKSRALSFLRKTEFLQTPTMILAPLFILGWYYLRKNNLVFPVSFFESDWSMFLQCFAPSLVLLFSSGLIGLLIQLELQQIEVLSSKPFVLVGRSYGKSIQSQIWPIVFGFVYPSAWLKSLPLIFSELLLIEVIFNAPGLGHIAWLAARSRDSHLLIQALSLMFFLYVFVMAGASGLTGRVSKRLKGYA